VGKIYFMAMFGYKKYGALLIFTSCTW